MIFGDTLLVPRGMDAYGSRSLAVGGIAVHRAAQKIVDKARKIAAHELEVAEEDLDYEAGRFSVKGAPDKAKTVAETAFSAWTAHNLPEGMEPGLDAQMIFDPTNLVFPYGAHICVTEVDTETGKVDITKYVAVDDVGKVINPMIVDGQVAGGVIQGIAEAMFEEAVYDEHGQLLTSSMTNYEVPAAMQAYGWRIIPVNPHADELLGERVYRTLADVPEDLGLVNVFRPSARAADVVRQAVEAGARAVWLQLGITSAEARDIAERNGLLYVEDRCIAVERARHAMRPAKAA